MPSGESGVCRRVCARNQANFRARAIGRATSGFGFSLQGLEAFFHTSKGMS